MGIVTADGVIFFSAIILYNIYLHHNKIKKKLLLPVKEQNKIENENVKIKNPVLQKHAGFQHLVCRLGCFYFSSLRVCLFLSPPRGCREPESYCISRSADRAGASSSRETTPSQLHTHTHTTAETVDMATSSLSHFGHIPACVLHANCEIRRHRSAYRNTPSCCTWGRCWVLQRKMRSSQLEKSQ